MHSKPHPPPPKATAFGGDFLAFLRLAPALLNLIIFSQMTKLTLTKDIIEYII